MPSRAESTADRKDQSPSFNWRRNLDELTCLLDIEALLDRRLAERVPAGQDRAYVILVLAVPVGWAGAHVLDHHRGAHRAVEHLELEAGLAAQQLDIAPREPGGGLSGETRSSSPELPMVVPCCLFYRVSYSTYIVL